jgi:hypothetical protein
MFKTFAEVDIDIDVMGRRVWPPGGTREDPYTDEGAEGRVQCFATRVVREWLRTAEFGLPAANGAGNPSEMQADHGGKENNGPKRVVLLGDELNCKLLHDR